MTAQATRGTAGAPRQMEGAAEVAGAAINALVPQMIDICGRRDVLTDPAELATYECDGLTSHRCSPGLVVLPTTAEQVAATMADWFAGEACDGFMIQGTHAPGGYEDVVRLLVPELTRLGIFRSEYDGPTLRDQLGIARPAAGDWPGGRTFEPVSGAT